MTTIAETKQEHPLVLAVPGPESGLHVTPEAFRRLSQANPELRLEREADGELIVMPPAAPDSSARNLCLSARLWIWNERAGLGKAFDSSAGFTLPNSAVRGPDAAWLTLERWEDLSQGERKRFSKIVPDFVAELRSSSDSLVKLRKKMMEYIQMGVRLGWMIDPITSTVEIHRPNQPAEVLARPETLSGEDVLPGFVLELKGILFD